MSSSYVFISEHLIIGINHISALRQGVPFCRFNKIKLVRVYQIHKKRFIKKKSVVENVDHINGLCEERW